MWIAIAACGATPPTSSRASDSSESCEPQCPTGRACIGGHCAATIANGDSFSCARMNNATIRCWGDNSNRALGDDDRRHEVCRRSDCAAFPLPVDGLRDVIEIVAGSSHVCVLRAGGTVSCWGHNLYRQLGDERLEHASCGKGRLEGDCSGSPVAVKGVSSAVQIVAAGMMTCARLASGDVTCWGASAYALGDGRTDHDRCGGGMLAAECTSRPILVRDVHDAIDLAIDSSFACVVHADGGVSCWGRDDVGQRVGDACGPKGMTSPCSRTPKRIPGLTGVAQIAIAGGAACVRSKDGAVRCWGSNSGGVLGDGRSDHARCKPAEAFKDFAKDFDCSAAPIRVPNVHAIEIEASGSIVCARSSEGTATCWGHDVYGRLGVGSKDGISVTAPPKLMAGLTSVEEIVVGESHTCARTAGDVVCWGSNTSAQLGSLPSEADSKSWTSPVPQEIRFGP